MSSSACAPSPDLLLIAILRHESRSYLLHALYQPPCISQPPRCPQLRRRPRRHPSPLPPKPHSESPPVGPMTPLPTPSARSLSYLDDCCEAASRVTGPARRRRAEREWPSCDGRPRMQPRDSCAARCSACSSLSLETPANLTRRLERWTPTENWASRSHRDVRHSRAPIRRMACRYRQYPTPTSILPCSSQRPPPIESRPS
ncbi:uncharacterized protein LAESUDRAFT_307662 [Laetiporus sulphureus 93-53]|uniref:Uncharacterized protein n=1 Tax=Laetiporus sulphureus 93-53 TaxID=1314785 RepID=A0A165D9I6_9APHY|nr:uncharacterized protein LAESUDRAFT_307662 [Laetiporus sulphureus 93-53]KZT04384.1 hypothetical protein LAESUDRAFT_307662 [Laetiporus sulphureus 93-53]